MRQISTRDKKKMTKRLTTIADRTAFNTAILIIQPNTVHIPFHGNGIRRSSVLSPWTNVWQRCSTNLEKACFKIVVQFLLDKGIFIFWILINTYETFQSKIKWTSQRGILHIGFNLRRVLNYNASRHLICSIICNSFQRENFQRKVTKVRRFLRIISTI